MATNFHYWNGCIVNELNIPFVLQFMEQLSVYLRKNRSLLIMHRVSIIIWDDDQVNIRPW